MVSCEEPYLRNLLPQRRPFQRESGRYRATCVRSRIRLGRVTAGHHLRWDAAACLLWHRCGQGERLPGRHLAPATRHSTAMLHPLRLGCRLPPTSRNHASSVNPVAGCVFDRWRVTAESPMGGDCRRRAQWTMASRDNTQLFGNRRTNRRMGVAPDRGAIIRVAPSAGAPSAGTLLFWSRRPGLNICESTGQTANPVQRSRSQSTPTLKDALGHGREMLFAGSHQRDRIIGSDTE
jgi:hypothetical protein